MNRFLITLLGAVTFCVPAFCQTASSESPNVEEGKEIWFDAIIGIENSGIVNGPEYSMPFTSSTTFPFYQSRNADKGEIIFDGQRYAGIPLFYDCYSDLVVLSLKRQSNFYSLVQLDTARIAEFRIYNHRFKKYPGHTSEKTGYYDVLYSSEAIELLAKRFKGRNIDTSTGRVEYLQEDKVYYKRDSRWYPFNGKRTLNDLVKDKKSIQEFVNTNNIRLKGASDADLIRIAKYLSENPNLLK